MHFRKRSRNTLPCPCGPQGPAGRSECRKAYFPAVDFGAFGAVGAVLLASALVACHVPAQRAAGVDPMIPLRQGWKRGLNCPAEFCLPFISDVESVGQERRWVFRFECW
jgi:hypothetical protein